MIEFKEMLFFSFFFAIQINIGNAQLSPKNIVWGMPLDISLLQTGSFGEIRPNHFHSGVDYRTVQTGFVLRAVADGYVSRLRVSPFGYGNAIYITHYNGYKSVYGHLDRYSEPIAAFVKNKQYEKQQFAVNLYPRESQFPVKKGDIIGYSGNSGRSFGPHLHFEIRDAETDVPINPQLFSFKIKDKTPPKPSMIVVYPLTDGASVGMSSTPVRLNLINKGNFYTIAENIEVWGKIGFGIEAYDYVDATSNRQAVYKVEYFIDNDLKLSWKMDNFSFYDSRDVNSMTDFEAVQITKNRIMQCFVEPNNDLDIYNFKKNNGVVEFFDTLNHTVKILLSDIYNNQTKVEFTVRSKKSKKSPIISREDTTFQYQSMTYKQDNHFFTNDIKISIFRKCLYDSIRFKYKKLKTDKSKYSDLHRIHHIGIPLQYPIWISIKTEIPERLKEKALIVRINEKGKNENKGGTYSDGYISALVKDFGDYYVTVDTIAPVIKPVNISNGANMKQTKSINFKITDNMSGIEQYDGYIDGNWILFEYDAKNDLLFHKFDGRIQSGKHELKLKIIDGRKNLTEYSINFQY